MEALIPKNKKLGEGFTKWEQTKGQVVHPQHDATKGQSRIGWLDSLLSLRKVVILCSYCRNKFNPGRFGYRRVYVPDYTGKTDGYTVNGDCDSCRCFTANAGGGTAFQPDELYALTHQDPAEARRRSRAAARKLSIFSAINRK